MDAVREVTGSNTEVIFEQNPSAQTLASQDISFAIVAVGECPYVEFGGDSRELPIHFNGAEIISLVADKVPTLVILIAGRPLVIEQRILDKVEAFVAAWLPGTEGGGITDVVFGDRGFQGRIPMTAFKGVDELRSNAVE